MERSYRGHIESLNIHPDTTIYAACPSGYASGGPELLHQFVHCLRVLGVHAKIFFPYTDGSDSDPVPPDYLFYENPYVTELAPGRNDILIVPESMTELINIHQGVRRVIWWLSVDNYKKILDLNKSHSKPRQILRQIRWWTSRKRRPFIFSLDRGLPVVHFYQSEYARQFLMANKIAPQKTYPLSDYINPKFLGHDFSNEAPRENVILYNPKKGMDVTQKLMAAAPDLIFEPLINLTRDQMAERLMRCKLYVDFGPHPGKDRIPREACALGCCVLTNRRGSAGNRLDVRIPDEFKVDDTAVHPDAIIATIRRVMADFPAQRERLAEYRLAIASEQAEFVRQVQYLAGDMAGPAGTAQ